MKKQYRIKKQRDFQFVFKKGRSFANRQFVIYVKDNKEVTHFRLGISVSKKLGNAVTRNKIKRRIRSFFQNHKEDLRNTEYVVIARQPVPNMKYQEIEKSLLHVLRIAKCIKNGGN